MGYFVDCKYSIDFPLLSHIGGTIYINTTSTLNCSALEFKKLVANADYQCISSLKESLPLQSTTQPEPSASSTSVDDIPERRRINTGGIAGGVVGSVLFIVGVLIGILAWKRRQRKSRINSRQTSVFYGRVEMEQRPGPTSNMYETGGTPLAELCEEHRKPGELEGTGATARNELDGMEQPAELEVVNGAHIAIARGSIDPGSNEKS